MADTECRSLEYLRHLSRLHEDWSMDQACCDWAVLEIERLQAEVADLTEEAFRLIARLETGGPHEGWYDSMARTDAINYGDRLVELGLWERHPDGYGRRWWYRPIIKPEKANG